MVTFSLTLCLSQLCCHTESHLLGLWRRAVGVLFVCEAGTTASCEVLARMFCLRGEAQEEPYLHSSIMYVPSGTHVLRQIFSHADCFVNKRVSSAIADWFGCAAHEEYGKWAYK